MRCLFPPQYIHKHFISGAIAGAISSAITTPFDVVKTLSATGKLPAGQGMIAGMESIVRTNGLLGLYAGVQPRIIMSAIFTAVGFSAFDAFKTLLGAGGEVPSSTGFHQYIPNT